MNKTTHILTLAALTALFAGGCVDTLSIQAQSFRQPTDNKIERIAVVDFAGEGGQAIADMLTMHLARRGYKVIERQNIDDLLGKAIEPIEKGETTATVTERLSRMGKLLNADAIITGDLVNLRPSRYSPAGKDRLTYEGAVCELSARAFDVRTREVFWTCVVNCVASAQTGEDLGTLDYIDQACYEVAESFSNPDYQNNGSRLYKGKEISARKHYAK